MASITENHRDPKDKYPGPRNTPEALRLHAQHDLACHALGGLILCLVDTTRPRLQILDSDTSDGHLLSSLIPLLPNPETRTLIGTDIAPFPPPKDLPSNIILQKQNILEEWPKDWEETFDFVHQRAELSNARTFKIGVDVVKRLIGLTKKGGYIQLVDGITLTGPICPPTSPQKNYSK